MQKLNTVLPCVILQYPRVENQFVSYFLIVCLLFKKIGYKLILNFRMLQYYARYLKIKTMAL